MRKGLQVKDLVMTGAFAALYFLCVGLGVLVGLIFDRSGNMFYAPAGEARSKNSEPLVSWES